jgi:hypothetical protein
MYRLKKKKKITMMKKKELFPIKLISSTRPGRAGTGKWKDTRLRCYQSTKANHGI